MEVLFTTIEFNIMCLVVCTDITLGDNSRGGVIRSSSSDMIDQWIEPLSGHTKDLKNV